MKTFADISVNQIAATHKNPRVKQLLIEKVTDYISKNSPVDVVTSIFKSIKDKLVTLVLKDTNNQVRDAAVNMIIAIKIKLNKSDENIQQLIDDAVEKLPKYRVSEINKKVSEATNVIEMPETNENYHKTIGGLNKM